MVNWFKKKKPEINVQKPIENPRLVAAFLRHHNEKTDNSAVNLSKEIKRAIYLVPILHGTMNVTPPDAKGNATIKEDNTINYVNCSNDKGEHYLPIFSDWAEIRKWTKQNVDTIVMPASDVWGFVNKDNYYSGAVINPGSIGWMLSQDNIAAISEEIGK